MSSPGEKEVGYVQKEVINYKEGTAEFRNEPIFCEEMKDEMFTPESLRSAIHVPSQQQHFF